MSENGHANRSRISTRKMKAEEENGKEAERTSISLRALSARLSFKVQFKRYSRRVGEEGRLLFDRR